MRAVTLAGHLAATIHVPLSVGTVFYPVPSDEWRKLTRVEDMNCGDIIDFEVREALRDARPHASELHTSIENAYTLVGDVVKDLLVLVGSQKARCPDPEQTLPQTADGLFLSSVSQNSGTSLQCRSRAFPDGCEKSMSIYRRRRFSCGA